MYYKLMTPEVAAAMIAENVEGRGVATRALLLADLTPGDGVLRKVTNDPTPANNGYYRKSGASGSGTWEQESFDRVALVEADLSARFPVVPLTANLYNPNLAENGALINDSGVLQTHANWAWSGLMPITPGVRHVFWLNASSGGFYQTIHFFGSAGLSAWLGSNVTLPATNTLVTQSNRHIATTPPAGAVYMAVNLFSTAHTTDDFNTRRAASMLEVGPAKTTFVAYQEGAPLAEDLAPIGLTRRVTDLEGEIERRPVMVVKTAATDYYVRSAWSDALDLCVLWTVGQSGRSVVQPHSTSLILRSTPYANTQTAHFATGAILHGATARHVFNDDPAPIRLNSGTIGGNHGHTPLRLVTATGHGKTTPDIGSVWSDTSGNRLVLVAIPSPDQLTLVREYTRDGAGAYTVPSGASGTTLTHYSGATNTGSITIESTITSSQLQPALRDQVQTVRLDGVDLAAAATGVYGGRELTITDAYTITSLAAIIDYAKARVGSSDPPNYASPSIAGLADMRMTYTITDAASTAVRMRVTMLEPVVARASMVAQSVALSVSGTRRLYGYIPDTLPISGFDFDAGVDLTGGGVDVEAVPAVWRYADVPPSRLGQVLTEADGTPVIGFALGISEGVADGRLAIRRALIGDGYAIHQPASSRKMYLMGFGSSGSGTPLAAGSRVEIVAFRRYFRPSDGSGVTLAGV